MRIIDKTSRSCVSGSPLSGSRPAIQFGSIAKQLLKCAGTKYSGKTPVKRSPQKEQLVQDSKPQGPMAKYARWLGHWEPEYNHITSQSTFMLCVSLFAICKSPWLQGSRPQETGLFCLTPGETHSMCHWLGHWQHKYSHISSQSNLMLFVRPGVEKHVSHKAHTPRCTCQPRYMVDGHIRALAWALEARVQPHHVPVCCL